MIQTKSGQLAAEPLPFITDERHVVSCHCVKTDEKGWWGGLSDHPPILPPGLMYIAQVAFIGFTKGLMTGIMRVM